MGDLTIYISTRDGITIVARHASVFIVLELQEPQLIDPRSTNRLTDENRGIRSPSGHKLLRTATPHLRGVQVVILIDAELMSAP